MRRALNRYSLVTALALILALRLGAALTIATYNVENYVVTDRMTPDGYRKAYPKPESEKRALRAVIHALNADVLVMQEMGPLPYLEELQRDLKAEGMAYPFRFLLDGPDADRHVAILSRRELRDVRAHAKIPFRYFGAPDAVKRGVLEVTVAEDGVPITLFAVHLKSRLTDREDDPQSLIRRSAEAAAVRDLILTRFPNPATARFMVLGDFNDTKATKPLQTFLKRGGTAVSSLLPATDSKGETWTHFYAKEDIYSRVDHVFASPAAKPMVKNGIAHIYDGPGVRDASDHRPVWFVVETEK